MKLLVDMNLSPEWVELLKAQGFDALHWSHLGQADSPDEEIFARARAEGWTILTQDLDFSQILYQTGASGPSTVLLRLGDELNEESRLRVVNLIRQCQKDLDSGALLVVDERKARLRVLPVS